MSIPLALDDFLWPNRYLLTSLGFWPLESKVTIIHRFFAYFRIFLTITFAYTLFIPQIITMYIYWGDISVLTEVGCISIAVIQLLFKLLYMLFYRRKFVDIYRSAKELWPIIHSKEEEEYFVKLPIIAKKFTIAFFLSGMSNIITFTTASIAVWINNYLHSNGTFYNRHFPLDLSYGIDVQKTPRFEIIFIYQTLSMIFGVTGVTGFDSTMMTLILHICSQFRLLNIRIQEIGNKMYIKSHNDVVVRSVTEIGQHIEHHRRTIRIAKEMKDLLSPVIFVQLMTSGIEICLSGYALMSGAEGRKRSEISQFTIYLITIFLQLIIWCWPGELLINESTNIGDAICYHLPWRMLPATQQRDLSFVIFRSQKECQVTALGFQVMSLRKLTEVFNTAASYFALLRSFNNQ